jgi:hypothetical protein
MYQAGFPFDSRKSYAVPATGTKFWVLGQSPSNLIRQVYHPMLAQAGLSKIRFQDLRHTACSLLLAAGVSIVVASGREGDLAATPQFWGTTSTLQIRKKKP